MRACQRQIGRTERHAGQADIVVTHWPPMMRAIDPQFMMHPRDQTLNGYFSNNWDDLIERIGASLWISGHAHTPHDLMVRGTRCISNPRGYREGRAHRGTGQGSRWKWSGKRNEGCPQVLRLSSSSRSTMPEAIDKTFNAVLAQVPQGKHPRWGGHSRGGADATGTSR